MNPKPSKLLWLSSLAALSYGAPAWATPESEQQTDSEPSRLHHQLAKEESSRPKEAAVKQAQAAVVVAEEHYQAGRYSEALAQFEQAYELMGGHPAQHRVLMNMGICQEKLLRLSEALQSYEAYLAALPSDDPERGSAQHKVDKLRTESGYLKIEVSPQPGVPTPPISIVIDGHPLPKADEYMLPKGEHVVEMTPQGIEGQKKNVQVEAGKHQDLNFELIDPYKEAKERVGKAEQLYEAGNYDAALIEFKRAYETMVGHPARAYVLYNVARCQERLYRYDAAVASYEKYLEIASDDEADRPKVEATIENLEGFLGTIKLTVRAAGNAQLKGYEVWVDGHLVGEDLKSFLIPGGTHQVELRAEGFEGASQEIQVPSRSEKSAEFDLKALAKEYKGLSKNYFYAAAGLTVASGAAGATFGIMTLTSRRAVDKLEPEEVAQKDADRVKQNAMIADIFFIGTGVFATTATILAFMTDWSPASSTQETGFQLKEVGLAPTRQGGYLSVEGTFSW